MIKTPSKFSWKKKAFAIAVILMSAVMAGWLTSRYFFPAQGKLIVEDTSRQGKQDLSITTSSEIKVPVTIFYPGEAGLVKEEKTLAGGSLPVKLAESLLQEYFKGLKNGLNNTIVRGVYEDRNKILYVDLSDEFRRNFSGEARYEYYLLKSLYQTLVTNVSEVRDVKILIEGREIDSIGGHMLSIRSLRETVWY
jgi:hypothetical protein